MTECTRAFKLISLRAVSKKPPICTNMYVSYMWLLKYVAHYIYVIKNIKWMYCMYLKQAVRVSAGG
jgi:hypothetical protein